MNINPIFNNHKPLLYLKIEGILIIMRQHSMLIAHVTVLTLYKRYTNLGIIHGKVHVCKCLKCEIEP